MDRGAVALSGADRDKHLQALHALARVPERRAELARLQAQIDADSRLVADWRSDVTRRYGLREGDVLDANGHIHRATVERSGFSVENVMLDRHEKTFNGHVIVEVLLESVCYRSGRRAGVLEVGESAEFRGQVHLRCESTASVAITRVTERIVLPDRTHATEPLMTGFEG